MNTVDYILVVLMAISGLVGVLRGFIREALSVLVWILALWGAARYGGQLGPLLSAVLDEPALQLWAARTLVFVGILFAGSLLGWLVGYLIRNSRRDWNRPGVGSAVWPGPWWYRDRAGTAGP